MKSFVGKRIANIARSGGFDRPSKRLFFSSVVPNSYYKSFVPPTNIRPRANISISASSSLASIPKEAIDIDLLILSNQLGGETPQAGIMKLVDPSEFSGHPVVFDKSGSPKILEDASKSLVVLSPGLGGGTSENSLYESWFPVSQLIDDPNLIVYSPLKDPDRPARFRRGLPSYYDASYINQEESENFFNKILKNRFFDEEGKLKDPKDVSNLILFGFSIGHRENLSHINYLRKQILKALVEEGKDQKLIQDYFYKMALINIGSPVNWEDIKLPTEILEGLESGKLSSAHAERYRDTNPIPIQLEQDKLPELRIVNYRSVLDFGTSKPKKDFNNFHCNAKLFVPKIFRFERGDDHSLEDMYLIGRGLVGELFFDGSDGVERIKVDGLGHHLSAYAQTINENEELKLPINSLLLLAAKSAKFDSDSYVNVGVVPNKTYKPDRVPKDLDRRTLETECTRAVIKSKAMRYYENTRSIVNPSPSTGNQR